MNQQEKVELMKFIEQYENIPPGTCCICGHSLDHHLDEGEGWRCHSLGQDGFQCECWLRKDEIADTKLFYDLKNRIDNNEEHQGMIAWLIRSLDAES